MDKDKKTWLIAFLALVVVLLVLSNFGVMTGKSALPRPQGETLTKVYVSNDKNVVDKEDLTVKPGAQLYITLETGSEGVYNRINFYKGIEEVRKKEASLNLRVSGCGGNFCDQNAIVSGNYKIGSDWLGTYCVAVKDRVIEKEVEKCLEVKA